MAGPHEDAQLLRSLLTILPKCRGKDYFDEPTQSPPYINPELMYYLHHQATSGELAWLMVETLGILRRRAANGGERGSPISRRT